MTPALQKFLMRLASPLLATVVLAWLMVLLVIGTVAQAEIGLYQAQLKYFSSLVFWIGPLPLPGGAATLGLLGVSLTAKILRQRWHRKSLGSLLAHLSVWLLLVGGLLTGLTSSEGYLKIAEGERSAVLHSYHTPELAVLGADGATVQTVPVEQLKPGAKLQLGSQHILVEDYFPNSHLQPRAAPLEDGLTIGARRFFDFTRKRAEADDERNRPTILFTKLDDAGAAQAKLVLFQNQPVPQPISHPADPSATLVLRPAQSPLPFAVQLERFEQEYYPGTAVARHYASAVEIISPHSGTWPAYVRMNEPLRYMGYTLYQASFINPEAVNTPHTSILAVVQNRGYLIPYAAGILLCVGLLLHLLLSLKPNLLGAVVLLVAVGAPSLHHAATSATSLQMQNFAQLPIQHEGRIKPLLTFAETQLEALHGQTSVQNATAPQWLAQLLFAPAQAHSQALFNLPSNQLVQRLNLPARSPRHYSYTEVSAALRPHFEALQTLAALPPAQRDPLDSQLLELAQQVQVYFVLSQALNTDAAPLPHPLTVMPPAPAEEAWRMPHESPNAAYLATWQTMAAAYRANDAQLWATAVAAAQRQSAAFSGVRPAALQVEIWLRQLHPFALTTALLALGLLMLGWLRTRRFAVVPLLLGWSVATLAVAARVFILQRPPVGTLYESILFVGLVTMLGAFLLAWKNRPQRTEWLLIAALTGLALQAVGIGFASGKGDTLGVLTAVLNTSFWLTTHVLVITAGYGLSLLAGAYALLRLWTPRRDSGKFLTPLILAALATTASGTLLGGIWADQSWGRFWGWDPKENGALILTLWLVWLLHGRLAGVFSPALYLGLTALTPLVVAWAWFGVNLLGVGLHSYGFMQGTFVWLVAFTLCNLSLAAVLVWKAQRA